MANDPSGRQELTELITLTRDHLHTASLAYLQVATESAQTIAEMAIALATTLRAGGKVMFCGNGGSAAQAQHLAAELVGRYLRERRALPSLALTTDTSVLTAIANDYGYEDVFLRQIEAIGQPGDVLVALSTSGASPSVILGAQSAQSKKITVLALTGQSGGELVRHADISLMVPSVDTPIVQEVHLAVGHILCDAVERALVAAPETFGMGRID